VEVALHLFTKICCTLGRGRFWIQGLLDFWPLRVQNPKDFTSRTFSYEERLYRFSVVNLLGTFFLPIAQALYISKVSIMIFRWVLHLLSCSHSVQVFTLYCCVFLIGAHRCCNLLCGKESNGALSLCVVRPLRLQVLSTTIIAVRSLPLSRSTHNRVIRKVTWLHPVFGSAFTPYPLFQCYPQS
jgi:hypothetical protein